MAFVTKYKAEITNVDNEVVLISIQEDGWTGTVQVFSIDSASPVNIIHESDPTNKHSYLIPSRAEVLFYTNDNWDMHDLLYGTDRQHKLIIQIGSKIEFEGWVMSGVQTESYTKGPYAINVIATCGLADLKNVPYLNATDELYDEYQLPIIIINNCLNKIGINVGIYENTDIWATAGMLTNPEIHTPLNQCYIHSRSYGNSVDDVLSCWDVLLKVMQALHCRLYRSTAVHSFLNAQFWIVSKINKLGEATRYRRMSGSSQVGDVLSTPTKTIETDLERIGGGGAVSVKQGYKQINLVTKRTPEFVLLTGKNFGEEDFTSTTTLAHWGTIVNAAWNVPPWTTAPFVKEEIGKNVTVALSCYQASYNSQLSGNPSSNNGGKVRISSLGSSIPAGHCIIIKNKDYLGMYRVLSSSGPGGSFDISANYVSSQNIFWRSVNGLQGIEYQYPLSLDANHIPIAAATHLKVELKYEIEEHIAGDTWGFVTASVVAYKSSGDKKVLNMEGRWIDQTSDDYFPLIETYETTYLNREPFKQEGSISVLADMSVDNNFYASGSPKLYIALYNTNRFPADRLVKWISVKVSMLFGSEKNITILIDDDFVNSLNEEIFHADGDGDANDEFRFLNPITDDASPKKFINSWQQDGGASDNLEDIIASNLANTYSDNSQVWEGVLRGNVSIRNTIVDPFNLNRVFQIQSIKRNLMNKLNQVSMIEINPSKGYYVELVSNTDGADAYYLSSTYGDISILFDDLYELEISDFRRISDGSIVEYAENRWTDAASSFVGGRTRIEISDAAFIGTIGSGLEIKGILRLK